MHASHGLQSSRHSVGHGRACIHQRLAVAPQRDLASPARMHTTVSPSTQLLRAQRISVHRLRNYPLTKYCVASYFSSAILSLPNISNGITSVKLNGFARCDMDYLGNHNKKFPFDMNRFVRNGKLNVSRFLLVISFEFRRLVQGVNTGECGPRVA